jgi:predicted dithiol-disulfide oxidoreductase (DUF899 family)
MFQVMREKNEQGAKQMTTAEQASIQAQLTETEAEMKRLQEKLVMLHKKMGRTIDQDWQLTGADDRTIAFSELFGDKQDLIVIHNMGKSCSYCTMWADEFNGALKHLENRATTVLISPDKPEVQQKYASSRGWNFHMVSSSGTTFKEDLGFVSSEGVMPGVQTFHKDADGKITLVATDFFGPGDLYNSVWHIFDLLQDGANEWEPRKQYK